MIAWLPAIRFADRADRETPIERLIRALPRHGWHLRTEAMRLVAEIVAATRPRLVLELGSGSSTVLLARQCASLGGGARVVSVEEKPFFAARTSRLLQRHGLLDRVSILVSPVVRTRIGSWRGYCYEISEAGIASALAGERADLVLIDGPMSAWTLRGDCRYGTLPLIRRWLADHAIVIVDDADRRRERDTIERWTAERLFEPLRFYAVGDGLSVGRVL
jgi:predicted O-methyltransferase YrrM